jgi:hypothetical protein
VDNFPVAQQTATSEVLGVISSSHGELEPVFQATLDNATHICEASFGNLYLRDGDAFRMVAAHNDPLPMPRHARASRFCCSRSVMPVALDRLLDRVSPHPD